MKVPLIGIAGPNTINRNTNEQQVIIWSRGEKLIKRSPRTHHYYKESKEGKEYQVLGSDHKKKYEKAILTFNRNNHIC